MKLTVIPPDKTIIIDDEAIQPVTITDLSWIPSDVHAVHWDSSTSKGFVEYIDGSKDSEGKIKWPHEITEIGIWQQAITDHASEKVAIANAKEAARDHLGEVKRYRDIMLYNSDWTQGNDSPLSSSKKSEWATYRQALRDIPATIAADSDLTAKVMADDLNHSSWPTKPS
tara:strand:+ start:92 stop:601 length:510 start_codon:yes stop_codon:yes gene_type:complete